MVNNVCWQRRNVLSICSYLAPWHLWGVFFWELRNANKPGQEVGVMKWKVPKKSGMFLPLCPLHIGRAGGLFVASSRHPQRCWLWQINKVNILIHSSVVLCNFVLCCENRKIKMIRVNSFAWNNLTWCIMFVFFCSDSLQRFFFFFF